MLDFSVSVAKEFRVVVANASGATIAVDEERGIALQVAVEVVHLLPIHIEFGDEAQVRIDVVGRQIAPLGKNASDVFA